MHVVNVPNIDDKRASLHASVSDNHAVVRAVIKDMDPPFNASTVCELYIGDHMFEPGKRDDLRRMVAEALVSAICHGRLVGYKMAQSNIRQALGVQS